MAQANLHAILSAPLIRGAAAALALLLLKVLEAIAGTDLLGRYLQVMAYLTVLATLLTSGAGSLMAKGVAESLASGRRQAVQSHRRYLGFVGIAAITVSAAAIAGQESDIATMGLFVFAGSLLTREVALLRGAGHPIKSDLIVAVLRPALMIGVVFFGDYFLALGGTRLLLEQCIAVLLCYGLAWQVNRNGGTSYVQRVAVGKVERGSESHLARRTMQLSVNQALIAATGQLDILILSWIAPPRQAAIFWACARGALLVSMLPGASFFALEPKLNGLWALRKIEEMRQVVISTLCMTAPVVILSGIVLVVGADAYLATFDESYVDEKNVMLVLTVCYSAWGLISFTEVIARVLALEGAILAATVAGALLNVGVSVCLYAKIGLTGVAVGTVAQYFAVAAVLIWGIRKKLRLHITGQ